MKKLFNKKLKEDNLIDYNPHFDDIKDTKKSLETSIEHDFEFLKDGFFLKYVFYDNLAFADNLEEISLGDNNINILLEQDNPFDKNAVSIYKNNHKLGYFYKNSKTRDVVINLNNDDNYKKEFIIVKKDLTKKWIGLKTAFYKQVESEKFYRIKTSILIENINNIKVNDWLLVEKRHNEEYIQYYTLLDKDNNEYGILDKQASDKVDKFYNDKYKLYAKIDNINEDMSVNITIYCVFMK